jgi:hypothetical protein
MKTLTEVEKFLQDMTGVPSMYNDSNVYEGQNWTTYEFCVHTFPVQRKLTKYECVFDLDDVSEWDIQMIPRWLNEIGFKFIAWQSGPSGLHIHFWTDVNGKEAKKEITRLMAKNIEEKFGIKNDLGPMGHGHIRTEFSVHPIKGYQKTFLMSNISPLFPKNDLSIEMKKKVADRCVSLPISSSNNAPRDGKTPKCVRYMLSNKFSDGRERIVFSLISWFKGSGLTDDEIFSKIFDWSQNQNYLISVGTIKSKIRSSSGRVGCNFRHQLLEELGHDVAECDWK